MSLTPEIEFEDLEDASEAVETSQTYRIDFENNRITNELINGLDAIRQFVYIALHTERYSYSVSAMISETNSRKCFQIRTRRMLIKKWRFQD